MLTNGLSGTTAIPAYFRCGSLFPVCRTCIAVSHPYGPAPLAGRPALEKLPSMLLKRWVLLLGGLLNGSELIASR